MQTEDHYDQFRGRVRAFEDAVEETAYNATVVARNEINPPTPLSPANRNAARAKLPRSQSGYTLEEQAVNSSDKRVRKQGLKAGLASQDALEKGAGSGTAAILTSHALHHSTVKGTQTAKHLGSFVANGVEEAMYREGANRRGWSIPETPQDDERSWRNYKDAAVGEFIREGKKYTPGNILKSELKGDFLDAVGDIAEERNLPFPKSKHANAAIRSFAANPDRLPPTDTPVWLSDYANPSDEISESEPDPTIEVSVKKLVLSKKGKKDKGKKGKGSK
ncbi:hypothetical protein ABW20_dc0107385 [Dactylellina cionopaga]|nr:hypothetical protein ABW20_dc0107385 [Dactylellina cionopaga]